MTLKKINPEELEVGKKYLIEMDYIEENKGTPFPLIFIDTLHGQCILPKNQPIYTREPLEPMEQTDNEELKMLVDVASRIYTNYSKMSLEESVREAKSIITACKRVLKENK